MKIKGEFILREVVGEFVLVPVGETALHFNGIISLTEGGAFIWKGLTEGLDEEQLLARMLEEYEVTESEARADLEEFLDMLRKNGLLTQ